MKFSVGDFAEREFDVTEEKVQEFAKMSGDFNPIHMDEEYAAGTKFGRRIAHGMLTASFLSALMADELPGPGAAFLKQTMKFASPVFIGDKILIRVEIVDYKASRKILSLKYSAKRVSDGQMAFSGDCMALYDVG